MNEHLKQEKEQKTNETVTVTDKEKLKKEILKDMKKFSPEAFELTEEEDIPVKIEFEQPEKTVEVKQEVKQSVKTIDDAIKEYENEAMQETETVTETETDSEEKIEVEEEEKSLETEEIEPEEEIIIKTQVQPKKSKIFRYKIIAVVCALVIVFMTTATILNSVQQDALSRQIQEIKNDKIQVELEKIIAKLTGADGAQNKIELVVDGEPKPVENPTKLESPTSLWDKICTAISRFFGGGI